MSRRYLYCVDFDNRCRTRKHCLSLCVSIRSFAIILKGVPSIDGLYSRTYPNAERQLEPKIFEEKVALATKVVPVSDERSFCSFSKTC